MTTTNAPFEPDWVKLQHVAYPVDNWRKVNADIHTVIEEYLAQLEAAGLVMIRQEDLDQAIRLLAKEGRTNWPGMDRLVAAAKGVGNAV